MQIKRNQIVRLGFVPVSDCAPLVLAESLGFYEQLGLRVQLVREKSWSSIRDKIFHGELDAAHSLATLPFAMNMGLHGRRAEVLTALVLSLQGNAITLSRDLWDKQVQSGSELRQYLFKTRRQLTFGVVHPGSCQHLLLDAWLKRHEIHPDTVRILEVNPDEMFPYLKLGYLDGFCVGEPWSSVSVLAGAGFCVATSADVAPRHPEKVFLTSRAFAEERHAEHLLLISALRAACAYAEMPEHRGEVCELLSQPRYVNAPLSCLKPALLGPFRFLPPESKAFCAFNLAYHDPTVFYQFQSNEPDRAKASWLVDGLCALNQIRLSGPDRLRLMEETFRLDLFDAASSAVPPTILSPFKKNYETNSISANR